MPGTMLNLNSGGEGTTPPHYVLPPSVIIFDRARQYCVSTGGVAIPPYPSWQVFFGVNYCYLLFNYFSVIITVTVIVIGTIVLLLLFI